MKYQRLFVSKFVYKLLGKILSILRSKDRYYNLYTVITSQVGLYLNLIAIDQSFYREFEQKTDISLRKFYKIRFGKTAPSGSDIVYINPDNIPGSIRELDMPENCVRYGILGGEWDKKSSGWSDTFWEGLWERFNESKEWSETQYYKTGTKRLCSKKSFGPLNGEQTVQNFENYLDDLDNLFNEVKTNGYDKKFPLTVNIGRNGEFLLIHGNHRLMIAKILGLDRVPVRVKFRHEEWQKKRIKAFKNSKNHSTKENKHPDIKYMVSRK